jgi:hypothetical protein
VVSEPVADLDGAWMEVPESTGLVVTEQDYEEVRFRPAGGPS